MSYFLKFVEFSETYVYYIAKNYLPLLQQIADSLKKIGLVGTLLQSRFWYIYLGGGINFKNVT